MIRSLLLIAVLSLALPPASAQEAAPDEESPPLASVDAPDLPAPEQRLARDPDESPEAYADRVHRLPPLPIGTIVILPNSVETPAGRTTVEARLQPWASNWQPRKPLTLDLTAAGRQGEFPLEGHFEVIDEKPACTAFEVVAGSARIAVTAEPPPVQGVACNPQGAWEVQAGIQNCSLSLVLVPAGRFVREPEPGTYKSGSYTMEGHRRPLFSRDPCVVAISRAFWIGKFPVTQQQYAALMGSNPSASGKAEPSAPVDNVSWSDAQAFIARLNALQDTFTFRLPTEAEWEYACRAGSEDSVYGPRDEIAWHRGNSGGTTHAVGRKQPNDLGLGDALGNLMQWCQDWHGSYPEGMITDPQGPASGQCRVIRGSAWNSAPTDVSLEIRRYAPPNRRASDLGFRLGASLRKK